MTNAILRARQKPRIYPAYCFLLGVATGLTFCTAALWLAVMP